ncbi:L-iditol 2-dehydrogenase [Phaeosphaeriaceae sp. PMI808]|nr:L-iditol 2-dehydrogenase [Phaeosphaeriaceae sp. PMI808]
MKAAQFFAQRDLRVADVSRPKPDEYGVLVAVESCGICGSGLHEYEHDRPHPVAGESIPFTMGHEFTGRIVIVVDPRIYCNKCSRCNIGATQACTTLGFKGLSRTGGGFSETVSVDANLYYTLPDHVDLRLAALIKPLTIAWHASSKNVLISGGGATGIACALSLRARGCNQVFVSELVSLGAAQNKQFYDATFNPIRENIGDRCRELTGGEDVDVVFNCAGVQKGLDAGMDALRYRGLYMNVALWGTPMVVPLLHFFLQEITTRSAVAYDDKDFKETFDAFIAGDQIHIDDIVHRGFEELVQHKNNHIRILVTPDKSKV